MIFVVDFGGQTAHLIARRVKELGGGTKIITPDTVLQEIEKESPQGIILSGGPASVYEAGAPSIDTAIFNKDIPILGICYGVQLAAHLLGGKVSPGRKEYGPATLQVTQKDALITQNLSNASTIWMSHGDTIEAVPGEWEVLGVTDSIPFAFVQNLKSKFFGIQFHPEVEHTEEGSTILKNFLDICGITGTNQEVSIEELIKKIKEEVGDGYVIGAISGGVDSTVAGVLAARAIGERFIPIYVENGLMREGTRAHVEKIFTTFHISPIVIDGEGEQVKRLQGITDSEQKRKIIGNFYIELFDIEAEKLIASGKPISHLLQGTIYSDVIESQGSKHAAKIKSHHNVGGLPENMKLKLLEPLREFYKDEVRMLGKKLGLSDEFVHKQPFPGPGFAVRIRGEVTPLRLAQERQADTIVLEELEKAGLMQKIFISFPVLTGAESTAVKGDGRFFGEVVALRVIESNDVMTATWMRLPYDLLQKISSRIVNEVDGVSRVVYDISTKPPATMEWE